MCLRTVRHRVPGASHQRKLLGGRRRTSAHSHVSYFVGSLFVVINTVFRVNKLTDGSHGLHEVVFTPKPVHVLTRKIAVTEEEIVDLQDVLPSTGVKSRYESVPHS